jgi:ClpX C4-type zinc finger
MGRPRLGEHVLSKTERQRRWRAKRGRSTGPGAAQPATAPTLHDRLVWMTDQRDQLREELDQLRRDIDAVQAVCVTCGRREDEVAVMFQGHRGPIGIRLCDRCVRSLAKQLETGDIRRIR